jgi:tetratricopeptide (TPR) repeat protein
MNSITQSILFLWLPIVVICFLGMPPKRAAIFAYIFGWLALPNIGYSIPGFTNYTKMTATVLAVLLSTLLFDPSRLLRFRPRWYDLPMAIYCVLPFITALTNDLGAYEGLAAMVDQTLSWGLPYLVGRLYVTDLGSIRDLCLGIVIGGLAYVPLCLIEIRFSPILHVLVFGVGTWEPLRYGGYRPKVFLSTGLELGMWMTCACLIGYQLWAIKAVKSLGRVSFPLLLVVLLITTILCKSTGAILLLIVGVAALFMTRLTRRSWVIWALVLLPPTYTALRTYNIWSARELVDYSAAMFGGDRAESLEFRLKMEDKLAEKAVERPIWGWGRFGRALVSNKQGRQMTIPDGLWIIILGSNGITGLATLLTIILLPMIVTLHRFPVKTWSDPQVGPVAVLALMLVLVMIDFLSNAMVNPLYALIAGGLLGQSPVRLASGGPEAENSLQLGSELMAEGRPAEAAQEFHRAIQLVADGDDIPGRQVHAKAVDGLGHSLAAIGRFDEAEGAFRDGLMIRDWLAAGAPDAGRFQDLAIARESLARLLVETGRSAEAVAERQIALKIWDILVAEHPKNLDYRTHRVEALNDLAWLLATDPEPSVRNPSLGLALAEEAVDSAGDHLASWNTLGVARYRAGDWAGAIEALERSALSSIDGLGTAFDHYFLSMAWSRLQHETQAREWLDRGIAWAARNRPGHPTLERFRAEAESLWRSETGPNGIVKA